MFDIGRRYMILETTMRMDLLRRQAAYLFVQINTNAMLNTYRYNTSISKWSLKSRDLSNVNSFVRQQSFIKISYLKSKR